MKQVKLKKLAMLLVIAMVFQIFLGNFGVNSVQAASKPILSDSSLSISKGKQSWNLYIENKKKSAKYTYSTSNKKIVTVDSKGVLTGVEAGKATITCKETYKKKTVVVGKCKVTVNNAKIYKDASGWLVIGKTCFKDGSMNVSNWDLIDYYNTNATYKFYSQDKSILDIKTNGVVVETKKAGNVKVSVKETYKGKTKTIGSFTISVNEPVLAVNGKTIDIGKNQTIYLEEYFQYIYYYYFVIDNGDENKDGNLFANFNEKGEFDGTLTAEKLGTSTITIYTDTEPLTDENYMTKTKLGTFTVNVIDIPTTSIDCNIDEDNMTKAVGNTDEFYLDVQPYDTTQEITVTSSAPDVVRVLNNGTINVEDAFFDLVYLKKGTSTITIKSGNITKTFDIIVEDNTIQSYDYKDFDLIIPKTNTGDKVSVTSSDESIATVEDIYMDEYDLGTDVGFTIYPQDKTGEVTVTITSGSDKYSFVYEIVGSEDIEDTDW